MNTLNSLEEIKKIDPGGMYEFVYDFPSQFEDGSKRAQEVLLPRWVAEPSMENTSPWASPTTLL